MSYTPTFRRNFFDMLRQLEAKYFDPSKTVWVDDHGAQLWDKRFELLNITVYAYDNKVDISTEVGVKGRNYNNKLFPRLVNLAQQNSPLIRNINNNYNCNGNFNSRINGFYDGVYQSCAFNRFIRLYCMKCFYYWIKDYPTINDYLKIIQPVILRGEITRSGISQNNCINDLSNLRPNIWSDDHNQNELVYQHYHWLEYLRITEYFDATPLENADDNSVQKFLKDSIEPAIERHIKGMELFDSVQPAR